MHVFLVFIIMAVSQQYVSGGEVVGPPMQYRDKRRMF